MKILQITYDQADSNSSHIFQRLLQVLRPVDLSFNTLSRAELAELLGLTLAEVAISLQFLYSLLLVPDCETDIIHIFHRFFPDFLIDQQRRQNLKFYVDPAFQHGEITRICPELMKKLKKICDLPQYVMASEVEDLAER
jgi:hypothetical protein